MISVYPVKLIIDFSIVTGETVGLFYSHENQHCKPQLSVSNSDDKKKHRTVG